MPSASSVPACPTLADDLVTQMKRRMASARIACQGAAIGKRGAVRGMRICRHDLTGARSLNVGPDNEWGSRGERRMKLLGVGVE